MLNEALRLVRIYHDKNQTELAKLLQISKSYLSEIEKGEKKVTLALLEKYSRALDIPLSSLLFFAEELEGVKHPSRTQVAVASSVLRFLKLVAGDRGDDAAHKKEEEKDRALSN